MERILVLKLLTDTLNITAVVDSIREELRSQGYPNPAVAVQEMYAIGDTVRIILNVWRGFPYISKHVKVRGYLASAMSYREVASRYSGRILRMRNLEKDLESLDRLFGNRSKIEMRGDTLVIRNILEPRLMGNIYVADSIRGSLEGKWDGLEMYYSENRTTVSIMVGLPSRYPSALWLNYRKEVGETYRAMLRRSSISAGIKYKPGYGIGLATAVFAGPFRGRFEYLNGWTLEGLLRTEFFSIGGYRSRTDTTFVGGAGDIPGYRENSIPAFQYLFIRAEFHVSMGIFFFIEPHWINRSRGILAFGGGVESRNLRIMIAKAGSNPPTLHVVIRN